MLNQHLYWNKARIDCLVSMVIALFFQGEHQFSQTREQKLFWLLKPGESLVLPEDHKIYDSDVSVYLSALRLEDGKLLIVATA